MALLIRASRFAISPLPVPASWYAIPLRLIAGFGFLQHGYAKLARGPDDFASVLLAIGVPAPELLGWATIIVEIVGGLFVLLGAFVPLATIPMAAVLLVAIATVHLPNGFSSDSPVTRPTSSISRYSSPCVLGGRARFPSMDIWAASGRCRLPSDSDQISRPV
jgi:uncharacterized membrane protein YphA (DoxX/SURF4 family)